MNMLPIAAYPSIVEEFLPKIRGDFSKPQLDNLARYLTGLIVCDNKTVTAINNAFVGHNDQSALNNWLTDSPWSDEKLDKARKDLAKEELHAINIKHAVLIVDDTLNHKTGEHMEGVNIHFDHAEGKTMLGHQLVTTHLAAGKLSIPLDFELYQRNRGQPDFKSKIEIAKQLIAKAAEAGFDFDCVIYDVWYFNFEMTSYTQSLGKDWVAGCKINLAHKFFQFIRPDKDYGLRNATYMKQCGRAIIISHCDKELRLITVAVDTKLDFCYAMAWDLQTRKCYLLIDKAGIE